MKTTDPVSLTDTDRERLQVATERLQPEPVAAYAHLVAELRESLGDDAYAVLGRAFAEHWQDTYDQYPDDPTEPTRAEFDRSFKDWMEDAKDWTARANLQIATTCEKCGRLRHGHKWGRETPPSGYSVRTGLCPACSRTTTR